MTEAEAQLNVDDVNAAGDDVIGSNDVRLADRTVGAGEEVDVMEKEEKEGFISNDDCKGWADVRTNPGVEQTCPEVMIEDQKTFDSKYQCISIFC